MQTPLSSRALALGAFLACTLPFAGALAQTSVTTNPVGFTQLPCLANSDSLISIPFTQPAAFQGAIASISGSTITVAATPNWTTNQFVYVSGTQSNTYYAIVGQNPVAITGAVTVTNGSTTVTGSGFTPIAVGDEITVNGLAYNVAAVASDTSLTISRAFTGTTASGLTATYDHSPKEGCYYTVTANSPNSLTVNLNGDSLATVAAGTSVSLIPYWTLGTAFPASAAGVSFIASTGTTTRTRQTQIFMPDLTDPGINLSSPASYFFYNGVWLLVGGNPALSCNDVILPPSTYFTVRNSSTSTTFTPTGSVYMDRLTNPLDTQSSTAQDNAVAIPRPTAVALNDLGLITSGAFTASSGSTTRTRQDTLVTYDNTVAGINKSSNATYYYYNGGWRLSGASPTIDYGATTISYGVGFTIRKAPASGATSFWQNTRSY